MLFLSIGLLFFLIVIWGGYNQIVASNINDDFSLLDIGGLGFLFLKVFLFFRENQMSKTRNSHGIKAGKIVEKLKQYLITKKYKTLTLMNCNNRKERMLKCTFLCFDIYLYNVWNKQNT